MTLPSGGNSPPISLSDLNTEFGYGTNLAAYQGKVIGTPGGGVKAFNSGAVVALSDFYGTNKVVGGSATLTSGTSYVIPQYKTIRVTVTAAGGGGAGGTGASDGVCPASSPGAGGTAGDSSFGVSGNAYYVSCQGGGGGAANGTNGTTYNGNAGNGGNNGTGGNAYGGSRTGGNGGSGAKTVTSYFTNPALSGGTGPTSAASTPMSIGALGGFGAGGKGSQRNFNGIGCFNNNLDGSPGTSGSAGSILIEWTGET